MTNTAMIILHIPLLILTVTSLGINLYENGKSRYLCWFYGLLFSSLAWILCTIGFYGTNEPDIARYLYDLKLPFVGLAGAFLLLFTLAYHGVIKKIKFLHLLVFLIVPMITFVFALTSPLHSFIRSEITAHTDGVFNTVTQSRAVWYWIHTAVCYLEMILSIVITFVKCVRQPKGGGRHSRYLAVGGAVILVANFIAISGIIAMPFDITLIAININILLTQFAISSGRENYFLSAARGDIVNFLEHMVFMVSHEDEIIDANPSAKAWVSKVAGSMPQSFARLVEIFEEKGFEFTMPTAGSIGASDLYTKVDGVETIYDMQVRVIYSAAGAEIGKSVIFEDVTDSRRLIEALNTEKERAQKASLAKSTFLTNASHQIRTPLNSVLGMTELILMEGNSPEDIRNYAMNIKQAGSGLLGIVNDLLDLSGIENNRLTLNNSRYKLSALIDDVSNIIRSRLVHKKVLFVIDADPSAPEWLIGDERRIQQILMNLLSNSVKYTLSGYIRLGVTYTKFDDELDEYLLNFTIEDSGIGIKEKDLDEIFKNFLQLDNARIRGIEGAGLGLSVTKQLVNLMQGTMRVESRYGKGTKFTLSIPQQTDTEVPFAAVSAREAFAAVYETRDIYRASICRTLEGLSVKHAVVDSAEALRQALEQDEAQSPGNPARFIFASSFLLYEVKNIISELESSAVAVQILQYGKPTSDPTSLTLSMPAHAASIARLIDHHEAGGGRVYNAYPRFTAPDFEVLIVDDLQTNLIVAEGLLKPFNMKIDTCMSGEKALLLVKKKQYDLILMDHMMPGIDGLQCTAAIRAISDEYAQIPIIALTANAVSGMRKMFLQNGMTDFLSKPIELEELHNIIDKWVPDSMKHSFEENPGKRGEEEFSVEIPGVDAAKGLTLTGGSALFYRNTLEVFAGDIGAKLRDIRDALAENAYARYRISVHALKSGAHSIGATELARLAGELEHAAEAEDHSLIAEKTPLLAAKLEALREDILRVVGENSSDNGTSAELMPLLEKLHAALRELDLREISRLEQEIRRGSWDGEIKKRVDEVFELIIMADYAEAENILAGLVQPQIVVK